MKITCDNCNARYSIADDKVRGKVFKIRCKKCSHIVVVRGAATAAPEVSTQEDAPPPERQAEIARWHIVVGREQVGPISAHEVKDRYSRGELNQDSYIWREGFSDWQRLHSVDEFSDLPAQQPAEPAPQVAESAPQAAESAAIAAAGMAAVVSEPAHTGGASGVDAAMGASLFGEATGGPAGTNGAGNRAAAGLAGKSMFESDGGSALGSDDDDGGSLQMTGQRGENSVLFSLANLQALAIGDKKKDSPPVAAAAVGNESSGLIDIRAMASATASTAASRGGDELPALSGFAPTAAAPVMLPTAAAERPPWLMPTLLGLGGALVLSIVILVVVVATRSPEQAPASATSVVQPGSTAADQPGQAAKPVPGQAAAVQGTAVAAHQTGAAQAEATASAVATQADTAAKPEATGGAKPVHSSRARRRAARRRRGAPRREPVRAPVAAAPAKPSAPAAGRPRAARDELDRMIDRALDPQRAPRRRAVAPKPAADPNLPAQLSRSQIVAGMKSVKGRVQACYDRYKVPGLANVVIRIASGGRVRSASVKGLFAGTPTGACVKRAVMTARFSKFRSSSMSITYPFMLR